MKRTIKKIFPWFLMIVISICVGVAVMDLLNARLLEREGVPTIGRMESPYWSATPQGSRRLRFEAVWGHNGQNHQAEFSLPPEKGVLFVDNDGSIRETRLKMHYVPSKPQVAAMDLQAPDPWWVSVILACVGLCALYGVVFYLIRQWRHPA